MSPAFKGRISVVLAHEIVDKQRLMGIWEPKLRVAWTFNEKTRTDLRNCFIIQPTIREFLKFPILLIVVDLELKIMDLVDIDSEEDSDYVPEEDPNFEPTTNVKEDKSTLVEIGFRRKRKAAELFDDLQKEDEAFIKSIISKSIPLHQQYYSLEYPINKTKRKLRRFFRVTSHQRKSLNKSPPVNSDTNNIFGSDKVDSEEIKRKAKEIISQIKKKTKVEEVKKFAGKEVR
jgi:hypothetical protein